MCNRVIYGDYKACPRRSYLQLYPTRFSSPYSLDFLPLDYVLGGENRKGKWGRGKYNNFREWIATFSLLYPFVGIFSSSIAGDRTGANNTKRRCLATLASAFNQHIQHFTVFDRSIPLVSLTDSNDSRCSCSKFRK